MKTEEDYNLMIKRNGKWGGRKEGRKEVGLLTNAGLEERLSCWRGFESSYCLSVQTVIAHDAAAPNNGLGFGAVYKRCGCGELVSMAVCSDPSQTLFALAGSISARLALTKFFMFSTMEKLRHGVSG